MTLVKTGGMEKLYSGATMMYPVAFFIVFESSRILLGMPSFVSLKESYKGIFKSTKLIISLWMFIDSKWF
jgi:hypothetical protein